MATETKTTPVQSVFDERQEVEDAAFKAKEERDAKKKQKAEEEARKKSDSQRGFGSAALKGGAGTGSVAQGQADLAEHTAKTFKDAKQEQADKIAEEINRSKEQLTPYYDDIMNQAKTDPDGALKRLNAGMGFLKATDVKLAYDNAQASLDAKQKLKDTLIKDLMSEYGLGQGKFDMEYLRARGKSMAGEKQSPNRAGLDKMIDDGAQQVEMPEIPDDMNAYLAETVVGMIGDITMNSIAWASGGTTAVAAASVPSAGQQVAANVSAMMATDVKQHREKVEKIRLLNEELRIKHQGDVVAAMIDFDRSVDASEREYNRMVFEATGMEVANAFKVMGMQERADEFIANMGNFIDGVKNEGEKINKSRQFEAQKFNTEWANRLKLAEIQNIADIQSARARADEARAKGRYVPYKDIMSALPIMSKNLIYSAPRAFMTMMALQENAGESFNNTMNYSAGTSKGNDIYAKVNGLNIDNATKALITDNILNAQTMGYKLNNVTDSTLMEIAKTRIMTIPKGRGFEEGGDIVAKHFTAISEREASYHAGTIEGVLRNLAASSNAEILSVKNRIGDKQKPAELQSFANTED